MKNVNFLNYLNDKVDLMRILEAISEGCYFLNDRWEFEYINKKAAQILDRTREALLGHCIWDILPKFKDTKVYNLYFKAFEEQRPQFFGTKTVCSKKVIEVMVFPCKYGIVVVFSNDNDKLEHDRHELFKETFNRLESFYNHSSEGIAIFDLEGRVTHANSAFEKIFGYSEREVKGKRLPVTPDFTMKDAEFLLNETIKGNYINEYVTIKQRKDQKYITVSITMSPIRDSNEEVYAVAGIVRDITRERAVLSQLESFIDNNMDPIMIFNNEEKLVRVNKALEKTFGWSSSELLGTLVNDLPFVPANRRHELERNRKSIRLNKGVKGMETIRIRKDGTPLHVLLTTFPVRDEYGMGWAVILRDITEKKRAEELMVHSEKLSIAGQLAASIAHEIRNPMTSIKGFMQLIESGVYKKEYFSIISSEFERIESILSELLLLAKPQVLKLKRENVYVILDQVISLLIAQANMNNIEIITTYEADEMLISCEGNQLKQVFINVVKNAIEAMPNGGQLRIETKREAENLHIYFIDQGCGIPEHILSRLGEPFYTTKEKGTGLGFMISKNIIEENHQGSLNVYSKENVGTTIEIMIPVEPSNVNNVMIK
ncbi:PAS domain S-box protein [Bacillus salitolerans]|uniref:histidine kinase n=1 Tax=Bacillus salitolerans TaxID=1437434 RepID=A0ABW4LY44_9BACI